jgi:hypothetical protein
MDQRGVVFCRSSIRSLDVHMYIYVYNIAKSARYFVDSAIHGGSILLIQLDTARINNINSELRLGIQFFYQNEMFTENLKILIFRLRPVLQRRRAYVRR